MPLVRFFLFLLLIPGMYHYSPAQPSVLATGEWYKIGITGKGLHKIDRAFLQKAGIHVSSVQPQHIKLYGNGGGMLPQANSSFRHRDLVENALYVEGKKMAVLMKAITCCFMPKARIPSDTMKPKKVHSPDQPIQRYGLLLFKYKQYSRITPTGPGQ
jgi:hypothetical protein